MTLEHQAPLETGRTTYGHALGVIMLDTRFARPPGDVGNASTYPFPVRYRVVRGASTDRVVGATDPALLEPFVEAARELAAEGVAAITTSCGFLAAFQEEMAGAVDVPVLTSSLLQVPTACRLVGAGRSVAVLTARPDMLDERHFRGAGWSIDELPVIVRWFDEGAVLPQVYTPAAGDPERLSAPAVQLEQEMVDLALATVRERPDVGALVLECTNFAPYSDAVRRATGLPVFDLLTLVEHAMCGAGRLRPLR